MTTATMIMNPAAIFTGKISLKWKILLNFLWLAGVAALFVLLAYYVFQVTSEASLSYSVRKAENSVESFAKGNKALEIEATAAGSLNNILNAISQSSFEKIGEAEYIKVVDNQVVRN